MLENNAPTLSIVVPMYNEEESLTFFFASIQKVMKELDISYEIVAVNDGSKDRTWRILQSYCRDIPQLVAIDLSRNFGKEPALTAGLQFARGQAIIPIDADLQDPPELIPEMLKRWNEGYEVVLATRTTREGESWVKKATARTFYKTIRRLTSIDIPDNTGDFRLIDRCVLQALLALNEKNRFMKGLFSWVGFRTTTIHYARAPRIAGTTKWNYWKLWNFALDGIFAFSNIPLKIWTYFGLLVSMSSFLYGLKVWLQTMLYGRDTPGYASTIMVILFLGGIQLISLGVIGEYLGRVFNEVKGRPNFIVREIKGQNWMKGHLSMPAAPIPGTYRMSLPFHEESMPSSTVQEAQGADLQTARMLAKFEANLEEKSVSKTNA